jgi:hypothetical protein
MSVRVEAHYHAHDDTIATRRYQTNRAQILESVRDIRNNRLTRRLDWARPVLCIPELDLMQLRAKYPELNSRDPLERTLAWKRFIASSESQPYRVNDGKA